MILPTPSMAHIGTSFVIPLDLKTKVLDMVVAMLNNSHSPKAFLAFKIHKVM